MAPDVEVEPLVGRPVPFVPKVPLAGEEGLVAMTLQLLRDGHFLVGEVVAVVRVEELVGVAVGLPGDPVGDVDAHGMPARHDAGPGGGAYGT